MAEQQLIDYIRTSQQGGISFDQIKQELLSAGWSQGQIEDAYRVISIPKPPTSVPTLTPTPLVTKSFAPKKIYTTPYSVMLSLVLVVSLLILTQNAVTDILDRFAAEPTPRGFLNSQEYKEFEQRVGNNYKPNKPVMVDFNSGSDYNSFYNQYFEIYKKHTASPSFRMMLNAIIVLPFWIITFLLFLSVKEERKKYGVLLWSYYVTSGWLLVFLFFNVARYIWNSNTVIGVYVVLGMLVIILTGAVCGVQKYRHSIE